MLRIVSGSEREEEQSVENDIMRFSVMCNFYVVRESRMK
jgi:hypothetical protein